MRHDVFEVPMAIPIEIPFEIEDLSVSEVRIRFREALEGIDRGTRFEVHSHGKRVAALVTGADLRCLCALSIIDSRHFLKAFAKTKDPAERKAIAIVLGWTETVQDGESFFEDREDGKDHD